MSVVPDAWDVSNIPAVMRHDVVSTVNSVGPLVDVTDMVCETGQSLLLYWTEKLSKLGETANVGGGNGGRTVRATSNSSVFTEERAKTVPV